MTNYDPPLPSSRIIDAQEQTFWRRVAEATEYVQLHPHAHVVFEYNGRKVSVTVLPEAQPGQTAYKVGMPERVRIVFAEIPKEPITLVVP